MNSTKLVNKPSFKLNLNKIDFEFEARDKNNNCFFQKNTTYSPLERNDEFNKNNIKQDTHSIAERFKLIEEENIRLREINEQLSRSLSMSTRYASFGSYNSLEFESDSNKYSTNNNEYLSLTSRTVNIRPNIVENIRTTVSDIIGDRSEIALSVNILNEEYFLGLEPIFNSQSARVVLLKTPSYWNIKKIPQFWEGFSNIMSSVIQKGLLNTLSYWSFLRAPPSPKRNVKRWEGITLKYRGPLKDYKGYSLAGNDDGLFVYLQSEEDAYDNIFYCNFRKKKKCIQENGDGSIEVKNILNLLHANTRSYICIDSKVKSRNNNISIKLSESKRNKLMFEEVNATELLTKQLLQSTRQQFSDEIDLINREMNYNSSIPSFRCNEQIIYKGTYSDTRSIERAFASRTVEPCSPIEKTCQFGSNSLAEELSSEIYKNANKSFNNFFRETNDFEGEQIEKKVIVKKMSDLETLKNSRVNSVSSSKMCSPRIRASNVISDQVSGVEYQEVPLTKRLNVVYIPSTTAVLVHDLVDSEDCSNNCQSDYEKISDVEQEYFKAHIKSKIH